MQTAAARRLLGNALQPAKLALQILGQRDEPAVIERHETAVRLVQSRQHLLHVDNKTLIDLDLARHLEPVALLRELDGELLRADGPADLERLALRPFEGRRGPCKPAPVRETRARLRVLRFRIRCSLIPQSSMAGQACISAFIAFFSASRSRLTRWRWPLTETSTEAPPCPAR